jgi:hypothetical protein
MWRVRSLEDRARHIGWDDDSGLEGDPASIAALDLELEAGTVTQLTVTGPPHRPAGRDDELGVFLLALQADVLPGQREIIGSPPRGEVYEVPEGAVA